MWVAFFGAYYVTTSTRRALATDAGQMAALSATIVLAVMAMFATIRLARTLKVRAPAVLRRGRASAWVLVAVVFASPALALVVERRDGSSGATAGDPPRGFILVSLDAARGDRISGLGYPRPTTPHIDAILANSLVFGRAHTEMSGSAPGHASMLSGLPPAAHGVTTNTGILGEEVVTMAERLRDAGFNTAAFIDNYFLESRFGFDQGFDTFINQYRATHLDGWHPRLLLRATSLFHFWARATQLSHPKSDDSIEEALTWLRHRPGGDFFVFLHVMDPHAPYDAPADLRDRFYAPQGPRVVDTEDLRRDMDRMSPDEAQALCDLYDGGVAQADRKVGRLIAELKKLDLFDSTLLVITSDHGEVLAEHGNVFDHGTMWNGDLHVPLIFSYPDRLPAGRLVEHPVSASAIVPTALALLDVPYEEQGKNGFHQSLLEPDPAWVFAIGAEQDRIGACVIGDRYKLMVCDGRTVGFYDLADDPGELRDLSPALATADSTLTWVREARRMEIALLAWQEKCKGSLVTAGVQALTDHDRENIRRLRSLGYVH